MIRSWLEESVLRVFLIIAILLLAGSVQAATLTVCPGGCDHSSIQSAIDAASSADIIEVYSGCYPEEVVLNKDVLLRGLDTGKGNPSVGIVWLCEHPMSSVTGFSVGMINAVSPGDLL